MLAPWFEEITTGQTGNTRCLRSGHKIDWFLALETLPVCPVVIFRNISRDKGQKAGRQVGPRTAFWDLLLEWDLLLARGAPLPPESIIIIIIIIIIIVILGCTPVGQNRTREPGCSARQACIVCRYGKLV